jgi:hypothetical protein
MEKKNVNKLDVLKADLAKEQVVLTTEIKGGGYAKPRKPINSGYISPEIMRAVFGNDWRTTFPQLSRVF